MSESGEPLLPTGDFLGDLTSETGDKHIVEFVAGGPKQYAYRLNDGSTVIKIRGITLNSTASRLLNFFTLKNMVTAFIADGEQGQVAVPIQQITRTAERDVLTKYGEKRYRIVYDKRIVSGRHGETLPYGYDDTEIDDFAAELEEYYKMNDNQ